MALTRLRRAENVPGDFFVDSSCIDCDQCRQIAPDSFIRIGEQAAVYSQPSDTKAEFAALKALVTCHDRLDRRARATSGRGRCSRLSRTDSRCSLLLRLCGRVLFRCFELPHRSSKWKHPCRFATICDATRTKCGNAGWNSLYLSDSQG